MINRERASCG